MESTIHWNNTKQTAPISMQTILVIYDGSVWPGVYANDKVNLYPEDFGSVKLVDCEWWAAIPEGPSDNQN